MTDQDLGSAATAVSAALEELRTLQQRGGAIMTTAPLQRLNAIAPHVLATINAAIDDLECKLDALKRAKRLHLEMYREIPTNETPQQTALRRASEGVDEPETPIA